MDILQQLKDAGLNPEPAPNGTLYIVDLNNGNIALVLINQADNSVFDVLTFKGWTLGTKTLYGAADIDVVAHLQQLKEGGAV